MSAANHTEIDLEWRVHGQGIVERKLESESHGQQFSPSQLLVMRLWAKIV